MSRKIIAILRGVKPGEVLEIAKTIADSGITKIEVPMNSPNFFDSIKLLHDELDDHIAVGAGTVTNTEQVKILQDIGIDFIVSPNFDPKVVEATKRANMLSYPGVITPTECFSALNCGADGLKFFPATLLGEANLIALGSSASKHTNIYGWWRWTRKFFIMDKCWCNWFWGRFWYL